MGTDQADERLEAGAGVPDGFDEVTDQHMASDVPDRLPGGPNGSRIERTRGPVLRYEDCDSGVGMVS